MSAHIDSSPPAFINYLLQGPLALPVPVWTLPGSRQQIAGGEEACGARGGRGAGGGHRNLSGDNYSKKMFRIGR